MAKSRTPPLLLIALAWAGAANAQGADPRSLVEAQQAQVREIIRPGCRRNDPDEITVCGRRDDRGPQGPLPALPYGPEPGGIPAGAQAGGEQRAAMAGDRCIRLCHQPVQINILAIGGRGVSGAVSAIGEAIGRLGDD
jgi:hypothetical protein